MGKRKHCRCQASECIKQEQRPCGNCMGGEYSYTEESSIIGSECVKTDANRLVREKVIPI